MAEKDSGNFKEKPSY